MIARCIRGVYPRGLIEAMPPVFSLSTDTTRIRGVYPRGLIEAVKRVLSWLMTKSASAGSTPAASLKLACDRWLRVEDNIAHPRGLPPRPH